jgi:hypothetical protein
VCQHGNLPVTSLSQADSDNMVHQLCYLLLYAPSIYCYSYPGLHGLSQFSLFPFPYHLGSPPEVSDVGNKDNSDMQSRATQQGSQPCRQTRSRRWGARDTVPDAPIFAAVRRLRQVLPQHQTCQQTSCFQALDLIGLAWLGSPKSSSLY